MEEESWCEERANERSRLVRDDEEDVEPSSMCFWGLGVAAEAELGG